MSTTIIAIGREREEGREGGREGGGGGERERVGR